jgi:hypothetical protein
MVTLTGEAVTGALGSAVSVSVLVQLGAGVHGVLAKLAETPVGSVEVILTVTAAGVPESVVRVTGTWILSPCRIVRFPGLLTE